MDPLIIEVRLNEDQPRDVNPHIPYAPHEIVREAVRAEAAGAAMVHWHVRDELTGELLNDVAAHEETLRGLSQETRLVLCPTRRSVVNLDFASNATSIADGVEPVDAYGLIDVVPLTFGPANVGAFPVDALLSNTRAETQELIEVLVRRGIAITAVCFELGHVRTARAYVDAGQVEPVLWQFVFTGDDVPGGAPPELSALQALRAVLPAGARWSATGAYGVDMFPLAAHTVALGGHVSIGLGDHGYSRLGSPDNATVVAELVKVANALGRTVATADEARAILGLRKREAG